MDIWARELNFTWDIYADVNNSWGLDPIEGTPGPRLMRIQLVRYLKKSPKIFT